MRLSSTQIYQQAVSAMQTKQTDLSKTQLQLSTGKKNLSPSDDPTAATRILDLNQVIETTTQFQRNADFANTRLSIEETVLTGVGDVLQRVRELSVQANNDTLSAGDRQGIAAEVRTNIEALIQLANSTDATGEYLFSGFKTDTIPFTADGSGNFSYDGDQGQRSLQIGVKRQVTVGDSGSEVFMKVDDGAGGVDTMFSVLYDFMTDLESNAPSATTLTRLDSALDSIMNTRATVGARLNTIESQKNANDSFSLLLQENRSSLEDLDYAEAVSRFEQQLLALQASQQTFVKVQGLSLFNYL
jgi:flagellar hook-associated protein 3 FlgL